MATSGFAVSVYVDNRENVTTAITGTTSPVVPVGKMLVVEHMSGYVAVREGDAVDQISATGRDDLSGTTGTVYLPVHFASRPLNFGGQLGVACMHQFGGPARLYVSAGNGVDFRADANSAGILKANLVGSLIDATIA
ncbi:hypothetical protein [Microbacterium deminutum]|uniref:Uncharacterized protein n=1 Tax=Microbacterium deminutum TaxID=344164 RepID=A0ABN2RED2_9MICO